MQQIPNRKRVAPYTNTKIGQVTQSQDCHVGIVVVTLQIILKFWFWFWFCCVFPCNIIGHCFGSDYWC